MSGQPRFKNNPFGCVGFSLHPESILKASRLFAFKEDDLLCMEKSVKKPCVRIPCWLCWFCCSKISKDMLCGMGLSKVKFTGSIIFLWTIRRSCGVAEIPAIDGSNTMFLQHFLMGSAKLLRYRMLSEVRSCIQLTYDIFSVARTSNTFNSLGTKNQRHTV